MMRSSKQAWLLRGLILITSTPVGNEHLEPRLRLSLFRWQWRLTRKQTFHMTGSKENAKGEWFKVEAMLLVQ